MLVLSLKFSKTSPVKMLKIAVVDNSGELRINLIFPESRVIGLHVLFFLPLIIIMGISLFKFSWWAPKDVCFVQECVTTVPDFPRSLILAPIERAYATSY